MDRPSDGGLCLAKVTAKETISKSILLEDSMLGHKVGERHLNLGDDNPRYFYSLIKSNRKKYEFHSIKDSYGTTHFDRNKVEGSLWSISRASSLRSNQAVAVGMISHN